MVDVKDAALAAIYASAVGDAVGYSVEFDRNPDVRVVRSFLGNQPLDVSDDTQMTMFCLSGLLKAMREKKHIVDTVRKSYIDWLTTQDYEYSNEAFSNEAFSPESLVSYKEMWAYRAPGGTCLDSLRKQAANKSSSIRKDGNGSGTVMRCLPYAMIGVAMGWSHELSREYARRDAGITHLSPDAIASSGLLAGIYHLCLTGSTVEDAAKRVLRDMWLTGDENDAGLSILKAYRDAANGETDGGWYSTEAVGLALYFAINCNSDLDEVITSASAIGGDSDTVASIAAALHAASTGQAPTTDQINRLDVIRPLRWLESEYLEL